MAPFKRKRLPVCRAFLHQASVNNDSAQTNQQAPEKINHFVMFPLLLPHPITFFLAIFESGLGLSGSFIS